jgi:type II secretory pathway pseudopilin PulG
MATGFKFCYPVIFTARLFALTIAMRHPEFSKPVAKPFARPSSPSPAANGFSYIALLIALAIISLTATATLQVGALVERRGAEEELLAIGSEFRAAMLSYANATIPGQARYPRTLQDLVKDNRFPNPRRHLRKVYIDPMTGNPEWGTLASFDGRGIVAVFSLSDGKPIKVANFDKGMEAFANAGTYRDWLFLGPGVDSGAPIKPTSPNAPGNIPGTIPGTKSGGNQVPENPGFPTR